jgi:tetratricopeptide (TPR) repeat protein
MSGAYEEYRSLMKARRYRDAATLARAQVDAAGAPKDRAFWLTRTAAALSRAGDHEKALQTARRALEADGSDPFAVYAAGEALEGLGRHSEALDHFEEASRDPRLGSRARRKVLECLQSTAQWAELLSRIPAAGLEEDVSLGFEIAADAGLERTQEALAKSRRRLEIRPHHPPALWQQVDLEARIEGLEPVLERYRKMARIPSLPPIYAEIHASLSRRAGREDEALAEYERLGGTGPSIERRRAFSLAKNHREEEAIPLFEELLRSDPVNRYLHSAYGAACKRVGLLSRAVAFYDTLIGLHPQEKSLHGRVRKLRNTLEENA